MNHEASAAGEAALRATAIADLYAALSACFSPPSEAMAQAARRGALAKPLQAAATAVGMDRERLAVTLAALHDARSAEDGDLENLRVEYARLFAGPGMPVAPPYESVHLDGEEAGRSGPLWGLATYAVRDAYEAAGLTPRPGPEPPDQLAAELEFAANLALAESDAWDAGRAEDAGMAGERRSAFVREHLGRWAPGLAARVIAEARQPLYRAAGALLEGILDLER